MKPIIEKTGVTADFSSEVKEPGGGGPGFHMVKIKITLNPEKMILRMQGCKIFSYERNLQ